MLDMIAHPVPPRPLYAITTDTVTLSPGHHLRPAVCAITHAVGVTFKGTYLDPRPFGSGLWFSTSPNNRHIKAVWIHGSIANRGTVPLTFTVECAPVRVQ